MTKPLHELSIAEAGAQMRGGSLTATRLTEYTLARIKALDGPLKSFITVTADRARADASAADEAFARGEDKGPLQGIPYGLKDLFDTKGILTTCHSKVLVDNVPDEDSACEEKLRAGGAVLVGKVATHEFAMGGPSFDLPFPPARNPWNLDYIPGGSSSGSAAAVAAGLLRTAMGSDTGGSIRCPAAYCGTIGLKPTYGLVSRRGVHPLSFTLDHAGPLTWTVEDCALTMQVVAGYDPRDPASANVPIPNFMKDIDAGVHGLRIGMPRHLYATAASPDVVAAIDTAAEALAKQGAIIEEVTLPEFDLFNAAGRVITHAEAFAVHEKTMQTRPLDYGRLTHNRMALGAFLSSADYVQAQRLRRELSMKLNLDVLKRCDALIAASALGPAPRFDEISPSKPLNWPMQTICYNVTGNPAMSIPTGFAANGLPLSMQIVGRPFDEPMVFRIGKAHETAANLTRLRPAMAIAEAA